MGRWVLFSTAVVQAVSPVWAGFDQGGPQDPVVVPPGPFFAVWGLVLLGCVVVSVRGLAARRAGEATFRRLHVPLALAQCGFVAWLALAATAPVFTVPVFVFVLGALVVALRSSPGRATGPDHVLIEAVLGVYAGWSAAAVWLNFATVLQRPPAPLLGALLIGSVLTVVALVTLVCRTTPARTTAAATGVWALLGVVLSTSDAHSLALAALAAVGAVAVALAATRTIRAHRTRTAGG